jgi:5-formyltetrahydrofolate cyclo-ligase
MATTSDLRKIILNEREKLTSSEREEKSKAITERFLQMAEKIGGTTIFLYVSFKSEVNTHGLIQLLLNSGKIVAVPVVSVRDRKMKAVRLVDLKNDLVSGYCGILEPKPEIIPTRCIDNRSIEIVVLPGSVFDERGGRLGYGGGYYDRFLAQEVSSSAARIALSYEFQVKKLIPQESHDEPVDYIITEKRVIKGGERGA